MGVSGTMTLDEAFAAVRMCVLIAVVCTFGLGNALEVTSQALCLIMPCIMSCSVGHAQYSMWAICNHHLPSADTFG